MSTPMDRAIQRHCEIPKVPPPVHVPIPIEILQEIFFIVVEQSYGNIFSNKLLTIQMVHLTYVCRLWRSAALSFPQMWFPVSFNQKLITLFLDRGGSSPLRLSTRRGHAFEGGDLATYLQLRPHSSRLEQIVLDGSHGFCRALFKEMGSDFSGLDFLQLLLKKDYYEDQTFSYPEDSLIEIEAPNLTHLELEFVKIASLASFNNLTHLYLTSVGGPITVGDVISLLIRSPRLRFLELSDLKRFGRSYGSAGRTVVLPELEYLALHCLTEDLVPLCRLLFPSVGPNTDLQIVEDLQIDHQALWKAATEGLWILQGSHELVCCLYEDGLREQTIEFRPLVIPESMTYITISLPGFEDFEAVITNPTLNVSRVTSLTIHMKFLHLLPRFPNVTRLAIYDQSGGFGHSIFTERVFCSRLVVRIALPRPGEWDKTEWMHILNSRVGLGHTPLKAVTFYLPYPNIRDHPRDSYTGWTEGLFFKLYDELVWDQWQLGDQS